MLRRAARVEALRGVPLLAGLSQRDLTRVLAGTTETRFASGDVIVKAGDRGGDLYLVVEGRARLTIPGRKARSLGPGDYFGEMAVLDGGPRSATIVAETPVSALRIDGPHFLSLLDVHGSVGRKVLVELSKRVRAAEGASGRL
jgi:CRP-like cAMP-binding protein